MTNTYNISGSGNFLQNVMRVLFLSVAAIGGFFMLAFSAAFAFFVIAGLVIVGFLAFAFFWTKAKLLGKPFGPKAQFAAATADMRADIETQFNSARQGQDIDGPIIDAHRTPEGWSVDD